MQRCPFRRSLALLGLAAWLVSISLTAGTRICSGRLGHCSPWLDPRQVAASVCCLVLRFSRVVQSTPGAACASERVLREGLGEFPGERLERARERELCANVSPFIIGLG